MANPTNPPSPEGSSPPPRHRASAGNLSKSSEEDLWDIAEEDESGENLASAGPDTSPIPPTPRSKPRLRGLLPRQDQYKSLEAPSALPIQPTGTPAPLAEAETPSEPHSEFVIPLAETPPPVPPSKRRVEAAFDDLDTRAPMPADELAWDEEPETEPLPQVTPPPADETGAPPQNTGSDSSEFAPAETDLSQAKSAAALFTFPKLSKVELGAFGALAALLVTAAIFFLVNGIGQIPSEKRPLSSADFPISGQRFEVVSAATYWREPIAEGLNADTFRRGTALLPAVDLVLKGNSGAIRVIFRDEKRAPAGDVVTRAVSGEVSLKIAGTAGFQEMGMHAAYLTGEVSSWTVEVLEGPPGGSSSADFKPIFEMPVSPSRR